MGIVKREGKWRLEKIEDGRYEITRRKNKKAEIITDEYTPSNTLGSGPSLTTEVIEVKNFKEAKKEFKNYIEEYESGSLSF